VTPTRTQWIALVGAVAVFAFGVGMLIGVNRATPDEPSASSVDVGFLQDMASHHEQAIRLSLLELRHGVDDTARSFATEIHYQQAYEIGAMERQLDDWGFSRQDRSPKAMAWMGHDAMPVAEMPGMASTTEFDTLSRASGKDADALFIRLMQDHHRGGVAMADYAAKHASNAWVREIAARMARVQRIEINEMDQAVTRNGLNPTPSGWTPDSFDAAHTATTDDMSHTGH
jgi:uncharacterized protein (DUF305 family)